jgi:hypothetical protein
MEGVVDVVERKRLADSGEWRVASRKKGFAAISWTVRRTFLMPVAMRGVRAAKSQVLDVGPFGKLRASSEAPTP